jgi:D-alanine--poly(phosphoribitol) ligase subunit 2
MEEVIGILTKIRPEFEFGGVADFFAKGMLDSFDFTSLVSALEERYNITIDAGDILPRNFRSVEAIVELLGKYGVTA